MSKRQAPDFSSILVQKGTATPPPQAVQRTAEAAPAGKAVAMVAPAAAPRAEKTVPKGRKRASLYDTPTEDLVSLAFRVPKEFRREFQRAAFDADMKFNAFLGALLDNWKRQKKAH